VSWQEILNRLEEAVEAPYLFEVLRMELSITGYILCCQDPLDVITAHASFSIIFVVIEIIYLDLAQDGTIGYKHMSKDFGVLIAIFTKALDIVGTPPLEYMDCGGFETISNASSGVIFIDLEV
jgi:hypothetical protein